MSNSDYEEGYATGSNRERERIIRILETDTTYAKMIAENVNREQHNRWLIKVIQGTETGSYGQWLMKGENQWET